MTAQALHPLVAAFLDALQREEDGWIVPAQALERLHRALGDAVSNPEELRRVAIDFVWVAYTLEVHEASTAAADVIIGALDRAAGSVSARNNTHRDRFATAPDPPSAGFSRVLEQRATLLPESSPRTKHLRPHDLAPRRKLS